MACEWKNDYEYIGVINLRNKMINIAALLVVMVALTGIAAAAPGVSSVVADPTPLTVGTAGFSIQKTTVTTDESALIADIKVVGTKDPNGNPYIITDVFDVEINNVPGTSITGLSDPSPTTYNFGYKFKGGITGNYKIKYVSDDVESGEYTVPATLNAIPEFPTVALPVAAIIGLVFFVQNRKESKK